MPSSATVTAKIGGGQSVVAQVFSNVTFLSLDLVAKVLTLVNNGITVQMDVNAETVLTDTITAGNHVFVIS